MSAPTFIDLFRGCGGFTLGMQRAGFECLAAVDFNAVAIATLRANLADVRHALEKDFANFRPEELAAGIGTRSVDVVVVGPPCQGFSTARQRDGSNQGDKRLKHDPDRHSCSVFLPALLAPATFSARSSPYARRTSDSTLVVQM